MRRSTLAGMVSFAVMTGATGEAAAQLHWEASAHVGAMKRFLEDRPEGPQLGGEGPDASFGPTAQLMAHVALLPLVQVGGYFGHDMSWAGDAPRNITFGGLRVKGLLPIVPKPFRAWGFLGFGYAGVYEHSFSGTFARAEPLTGGALEVRPGRVEGAGGSFFDLPFGIGGSYMFRKPWSISAELGARVGFGHTGSVYEAPGPRLTIPETSPQHALPAGLDRFALGLTVGVSVDL